VLFEHQLLSENDIMDCECSSDSAWSGSGPFKSGPGSKLFKLEMANSNCLKTLTAMNKNQIMKNHNLSSFLAAALEKIH
jgi:hypothetical protein